MGHLASHLLIRWIAYPVLYWVGFAVLQALSSGKANILSYSELDKSKDLVWYEFRVLRGGLKFWPPESVILVGGSVSLVVMLSYCTWRYR